MKNGPNCTSGGPGSRRPKSTASTYASGPRSKAGRIGHGGNRRKQDLRSGGPGMTFGPSRTGQHRTRYAFQKHRLAFTDSGRIRTGHSRQTITAVVRQQRAGLRGIPCCFFMLVVAAGWLLVRKRKISTTLFSGSCSALAQPSGCGLYRPDDFILAFFSVLSLMNRP